MDIREWIEKVVARLAELIAVNRGSMVVNGQIGTVETDERLRYGRLGLTVEEAFELTYLRGIFDGLAHGQPAPVMHAVMARIQAEINGTQIVIPTSEQRIELLRAPAPKRILEGKK